MHAIKTGIRIPAYNNPGRRLPPAGTVISINIYIIDMNEISYHRSIMPSWLPGLAEAIKPFRAIKPSWS